MADLTYQDVLNILRLIDAGPFSHLEIELDGTRLKVARRAGAAPEQRGAPALREPPAPPAAEKPAAEKSAAGERSPEVPPPPAEAADVPDGIAVKPPMEGTFYAAPSPGAEPFASAGKRVRKGEQLGSVEVMKLFTPVAAPCDGTVRAILVRNEQVVAKDQTLMVIAPDA